MNGVLRDQCPSSFALDAFRLGLDAAPADHIAGCLHCTAWLAAQDRLEAKLEAKGAPRWAPSSPRAGRVPWKFVLRLGLPLALGAAALVFTARPRPTAETAKGSPASVQIARARSGLVSWLASTDELAPQDAIRFVVRRSDPDDRYVLAGSVDGSGELARFYPAAADGCSVALPATAEPLAGSIAIDGAPGPERIVVVVSHQPLCWPDVGAAVARFAREGSLPRELVAADRHATRVVVPKAARADP